jgi:hypothetical protein
VESLDWEDVSETLHDGTPDEIIKIHCPDCGGNLCYEYKRFGDDGSASFDIKCDNCGMRDNGYLISGHEIPCCVEYFGNEARIYENLKELQTA